MTGMVGVGVAMKLWMARFINHGLDLHHIYRGIKCVHF